LTGKKKDVKIANVAQNGGKR